MQISSAEAEPISPNAFAISLTCDNTIFYSLLRRNFSKGFGLFLVGCQVKTLTKILVTSALSQIRSLDFAKTTMVKEISIFQKFNHRPPPSHQDTVLHRQVQPNPPLHGTNPTSSQYNDTHPFLQKGTQPTEATYSTFLQQDA